MYEKQILDVDLGVGFHSLRDSSVGELIHSGGVAVRTSLVSYVACAGYVSFADGDTVVFLDDLEGQTRQVFSNLEKCLVEAGLGLADIVRYRVHVQPPFEEADLAVVNRVAAETFRSVGIQAPAGTYIIVHKLATPGLLIEIDCDAVVSRAPADAGGTTPSALSDESVV
jgi:enamine deaminase RidA (YjgF/YER057c/UK114 family)